MAWNIAPELYRRMSPEQFNSQLFFSTQQWLGESTSGKSFSLSFVLSFVFPTESCTENWDRFVYLRLFLWNENIQDSSFPTERLSLFPDQHFLRPSLHPLLIQAIGKGLSSYPPEQTFLRRYSVTAEKSGSTTSRHQNKDEKKDSIAVTAVHTLFHQPFCSAVSDGAGNRVGYRFAFLSAQASLARHR